MTQPTRYLIRMVIFLIAVYGLAAFISPALIPFYMANPVVNSVIVAVEVFGVIWNLRQVLRLQPEVTWVERFKRARGSIEQVHPPKLLSPMARMLSGRGEGDRRLTISVQSMRTLLDGIASRLDESRELSRYVTGVMIFLGLLGTFWGLLKTVSSVGAVIHGMSLAGGDVNAMFDQLKSGLAGPLAGMGTAFSSSMFGLSGALILGFLDLTAGQAMNRFFNELEEWLAGLTRLSSGVLGSEGDTAVPVYVQALLEQAAENMEALQRVLTRTEDGRAQSNQLIQTLAERMNTLVDVMQAGQKVMLKIGEGQAVLTRLADHHEAGGDDIARAHLRNIELLLNRLIAETEQGRAQSTADLRSDIRLLARTLGRYDEARG